MHHWYVARDTGSGVCTRSPTRSVFAQAWVLTAVRQLTRAHPDLDVVFPLHPNQALHHDIRTALGDQPQVRVTPPLGYPELLRTLDRAHLVLSDSGGILEEAVTLRTPVVVLRDVTDRRGTAQPVRDGQAAVRAEQAVAWLLGQADRPEPLRPPTQRTPLPSHRA